MLAAVTVPLQAVRGECINLGSGGHQSINRLVELLEGDVVHIPKRPGEPDITFADTTKATDLLGWKAEVEFEQGVRTMLDNIDYWADAPLWTPDSIEEATRDWFVHLSVDD
jgi:UDP-glucose 4-epimerase